MYKNRLSPITQQSVIEQASPTELKPGKILYDLTVNHLFILQGVKTQFSNILDSFSKELNNIVEELKEIEEKNKYKFIYKGIFFR